MLWEVRVFCFAFPRMNRAIPEQNSKLRVIFLTKILIRLNWLFQWLLLFLLVGELYLLLGNSPQGVHGGPMGWGGSCHTCLPRQVAASAFPLSFYSGILLGPPSIPLCQPVLLAPLVTTLSTTVDERKPVRCQSFIRFVPQWGATDSSLCPLCWSGTKATCGQYSSEILVEPFVLVC